MDETITLKSDERGRITIPSRVREYLDVEDDEKVWYEVTIHGLDPEKHPQQSSIGNGGES